MNCERKGIVLFAIAYNEGNYIHEWLNYHLGLGIDKIIVLCNGGFDFDSSMYDDRVEKVLFEEKMYITTIQNVFLNKYFEYAQDLWNYRYFIHIDIDEFIVLRGKYFGKTLEQALDEINIPILMIRWKYFGDNFCLTDTSTSHSVIDRFTRSSEGLKSNSGKSILRLDEYIKDYFSNPHFLNMYNYEMESGTIVSGGHPMIDEKDEDVNLYLAHFASKTLFEYLNRQPHLDKGQHGILDTTTRIIERFKIGVNANDIENLDVMKCRDYYCK